MGLPFYSKTYTHRLQFRLWWHNQSWKDTFTVYTLHRRYTQWNMDCLLQSDCITEKQREKKSDSTHRKGMELYQVNAMCAHWLDRASNTYTSSTHAVTTWMYSCSAWGGLHTKGRTRTFSPPIVLSSWWSRLPLIMDVMNCTKPFFSLPHYQWGSNGLGSTIATRCSRTLLSPF